MNPPVFVSVSTEPGITSAERQSIRYDEFVRKLLKPLPENLNALHIALGLAGELCEILDLQADYKEEFGDFIFYLQAGLLHYNLEASDCFGLDEYTITRINVVDQLILSTGYMVDLIKKEYIYEKPRDLEEIKKTFAWIITCVSVYIQCLGLKQQDIIQGNALKLEKRYAGLYYSDESAIARNDKSS